MSWSANLMAQLGIFVGQATAVAPPPTAPWETFSPPAPKKMVEPLLELENPPPSQDISSIESLRLSSPWQFTPSGVLKTPTVEIDHLVCRRTAFRYFSCEYQMRFREFEGSDFGPWTIRRSVFTQFNSDWVMYDEKERCAKFKPKDLPKYCFKSM